MILDLGNDVFNLNSISLAYRVPIQQKLLPLNILLYGYYRYIALRITNCILIH